MSEPTVLVLGGGPAGVGAAYQLRRLGRARVTLIEQQEVVGGNAGSFEAAGQRLDYGSHRLHSSTDPQILDDIRALIGDDLLDRPRNGRIRLRGRWVQFPLKPLDLVRRLDRGFAFGVARDMARGLVPRKGPEPDSFASALMGTLGPTICQQFYFPYARKIWGREPEQLSAISAKRRVSAGTFRKLAKRLIRPPGAGRFYYPRGGYGQISEAYADAARNAGAELLLGWRVASLSRSENGKSAWQVTVERAGEQRVLSADHVWSTLPIPLVARMLRPSAPSSVLEAAGNIQYRAMLLVYLHLDMDRFQDTDAHYFPEENVVFSRVSEPKNYAALPEPHGRTTLCAEVPCNVGDAIWNMSEAELMQRLMDDLARVDLPLPRRPVGIHVKRLSHAYPIYNRGYEKHFEVLDTWAESLPNFLTYGRQGLFAHDNTHHALYMAYAAADCLNESGFSQEKWNDYRRIFATHVVED
jgi:protoporphyrinogen oxidase